MADKRTRLPDKTDQPTTKMKTLKFMHPQKGHQLLAWPETITEEDQAAKDAVEEAERLFRENIGKGYLAAKVITPAAQGRPAEFEQIRKFDPQADIVMYPQAQGGC